MKHIDVHYMQICLGLLSVSGTERDIFEYEERYLIIRCALRSLVEKERPFPTNL